MTQFITTQRDGMTRNGLTYSLAGNLHHAAPYAVTMCMYPFSSGTDLSNPAQYWSNSNSVPHACIGGDENAGDRWWEPKLSEGIVSFISGRSNVFGEAAVWPAEKNTCMILPLGVVLPQAWLRQVVLPQANPWPAKPEPYEPGPLAVACPPHSQGDNVFNGCVCDAGYSGVIIGTFSAPNFYSGTCEAVSCPSRSLGKSVASGCVCDNGYSGNITAISESPFYSGECDTTTTTTTEKQSAAPPRRRHAAATLTVALSLFIGYSC